jgi:hypothetical protein
MSRLYTRANYRTPTNSLGIVPRKVYPEPSPEFKAARKHLQKLQKLQLNVLPPIRFKLPGGGWGERGADDMLQNHQIIQLATLISENGIDVKKFVGNQPISNKKASELINNLRNIQKANCVKDA